MPETERMSPEGLMRLATELLEHESQAIAGLKQQLDQDALWNALNTMLDCSGLIIAIGAGTSSSLARRFAHLLTCSGKPSVFVDPGQAQHGYSAIVTARDVLIAFSRGGETDEMNHLLKVAHGVGAKIISITEAPDSTMARLSDVILRAKVAPEHDVKGVIPLASTLAHAAVGDILCLAMLSLRGYDPQQFAMLHPGGAVGKRLGGKKP